MAEWQTRMIQVHIGDSEGSSPFPRTNKLKRFAVVAEWQTRTLEVRMGDRVGSSPTDRTTK